MREGESGNPGIVKFKEKHSKGTQEKLRIKKTLQKLTVGGYRNKFEE